VYGLIESSNLGLAIQVLAALAVGVVTLSAFIFVEAHSQAPMMPLTLFRSQTLAGQTADFAIVRRLRRSSFPLI